MCDVHRLFSGLGKVHLVEGRDINPGQLKGVDVLLVRSVTAVDEKLLADSSLKFVGSATSGIDHVDRDELVRRGIPFAYAPGSNAESVIQYVLSAIAGSGERLEHLLAGGSVGIIGYGVIGRALLQRLECLGIRCVAHDPWLDHGTFPKLASLESALSCDVICIHAELTRREPFPSFHLLDSETLGQLRPGSLLVNAGRGAVVDNSALLALLAAGTDLQVVLDVWEGEPVINRALMAYCLYATPHIAGYSYDGKLRATAMLHAAFCDALGLTPGQVVADPATQARTQVAAYAGRPDNEAEFLRWLLGQAYDIRDDDQAMRGNLDSKGFDGLRRDYPVRRELSTFSLPTTCGFTVRQLELAAILGCQVE